jgi:hypothetical protein
MHLLIPAVQPRVKSTLKFDVACINYGTVRCRRLTFNNKKLRYAKAADKWAYSI